MLEWNESLEMKSYNCGRLLEKSFFSYSSSYKAGRELSLSLSSNELHLKEEKGTGKLAVFYVRAILLLFKLSEVGV